VTPAHTSRAVDWLPVAAGGTPVQDRGGGDADRWAATTMWVGTGRGQAADVWALATVPGLNFFPSSVKTGQIQLNLNFKLIQTLTDPKWIFVSSKFFN
jgi:hypothetical protein